MPGIIGRKIGMTSIYSVEGKATPCTVIEAGPCVVTQVKTTEKDGYEAVQLGYGERKEKNTPNALKGHFKKAKTTPKTDVVEFSGFENLSIGESINVGLFEEGEYVSISGTSKGKGFQGVVKRWNFSGGPASHGSMFHRRGGSYGLCQWPGRVFKNKKMPGHTGSAKRTTQNLQLVKILPEKNLLLIKGSVPGSKGTILTVRVAKKTKVSN